MSRLFALHWREDAQIALFTSSICTCACRNPAACGTNQGKRNRRFEGWRVAGLFAPHWREDAAGLFLNRAWMSVGWWQQPVHIIWCYTKKKHQVVAPPFLNPEPKPLNG